MLINRTYKTYLHDYPYISGAANIPNSVNDFPYHAICPNDIISLTTTIRSDIIMTEDISLLIRVNGDTNRHILLYSGDISGVAYDDENRFWGNFQNVDLTEYGFIGIFINGVKYYVQVYDGAGTIICSSNLVGDFYTDGTFIESGFALLRVNSTNFKYVRVYLKI